MTGPRKRMSGPVSPHRPRWQQRLGARGVHGVVNAVAATRWFRIRDPHGALEVMARRPVIFAVWHNRLAFSLIVYRRVVVPTRPGRRMAALVSASRDGAFLSAILEAFGVQPVRGSTSRRGPQALLEMTTWAEQGFDLAITPDGPRGPRYRVQTGILGLARVTGLPIIPVACNTGWRLTLRSWDRFQVPLPLGGCEVAFGEPLLVEPGDEGLLEPVRVELESRLLSVTRD